MPDVNQVQLDAAGARHLPTLREMLFLSFQWRADEPKEELETVLRRPEAFRFWSDFGRRGDFGFIASRDGVEVGAAWCRLLAADDHGYSFIDESTPCLAIAVAQLQRNQGIGAKLLDAIFARAREIGHSCISLAVETGNPAVRLYERRGFQRDREIKGYLRMVARL